MKAAIVISGLALLSIVGIVANGDLGSNLTKTDMERFKTSPNFKNGRFVNMEETPVMNPESSTLKIMREFLKKGDNREPDSILNTIKFNKDEFLKHKTGIHYVWFGHSSVLLNIDGVIMLCDPVFSERVSPVSFAGTKKFAYSNDLKISDLPHIDWVLISHNHYDHLDAKSIKQLKDKTDKFVVPLGVGAHLKKWKVSPEKIEELDWWENFTTDTLLSITATPARHFSGRGLKRNTTLWCSFVIIVNEHKVYFNGDSGYGKHFKQIGEKFGPFDMAFLECGQYNSDWALIHMNPTETYMAFTDLNCKKMTPIHWGKFKLSLHTWTEPVEVLLNAANGNGNAVIIPEIGQLVSVDEVNEKKLWWE